MRVVRPCIPGLCQTRRQLAALQIKRRSLFLDRDLRVEGNVVLDVRGAALWLRVVPGDVVQFLAIHDYIQVAGNALPRARRLKRAFRENTAIDRLGREVDIALNDFIVFGFGEGVSVVTGACDSNSPRGSPAPDRVIGTGYVAAISLFDARNPWKVADVTDARIFRRRAESDGDRAYRFLARQARVASAGQVGDRRFLLYMPGAAALYALHERAVPVGIHHHIAPASGASLVQDHNLVPPSGRE